MRIAALSILLFGSVLAGRSWAADIGTYRPGQVYHSVTASSPGQCAAQCQGDAQCKGWNFVRPRSAARTGVCEFNAVAAAPVVSDVSVSGENVSARTSPHLVQAGTRTVRVGAAPQQSPRRVVTMETETQSQAIAASSSRVPEPAPRTRMFQHNLDGGARAPQNYAPQAQPQPMRKAPQMMPQNRASMFQHNLEGGRPVMPPMPQQPAFPPQAPQRSAYAAPHMQNPPVQMPPQYQRQPQTQAAPQMTLPPQTVASAQNSLFGSLNDDVTVPSTLTPETMPSDPNAPISTSQAVPTRQVLTEALPRMAGGRRR